MAKLCLNAGGRRNRFFVSSEGSTCVLTSQMAMKSISNAEYAAIDDINITITGYAIGTEDVPMIPTETWNVCKVIGEIE